MHDVLFFSYFVSNEMIWLQKKAFKISKPPLVTEYLAFIYILISDCYLSMQWTHPNHPNSIFWAILGPTHRFAKINRAIQNTQVHSCHNRNIFELLYMANLIQTTLLFSCFYIVTYNINHLLRTHIGNVYHNWWSLSFSAIHL